jgi:hypothetical protein
MTTATDIAALKARCTALEKRVAATETKDAALSTAATALTARVAKLEAVKPRDYSLQIAELRKDVDALKYIISSSAERHVLSTASSAGRLTSASVLLSKVVGVGEYYNALSICHGDGVTDDTNHILAAIASYKAAGKAGVYFPAGNYYLASPLTVPADTVLVGPAVAAIPINGAKTDGGGCQTPTAWLMGRVNFNSTSTFSDLKIGPASAGLCALALGSATVATTSFTRCQFRGGGGDRTTSNYTDTHVISFRHQTQGDLIAPTYITFTDCNIECNLGVEDATHSKHLDNVYISPNRYGNLNFHHVLWHGCHFGISNGVRDGSPRFQVEIWNYPGTTNVTPQGFRDINFEDCVFESADDEILDYSGSSCADGITPNDGYSHVTGCVFKGDGKAYMWNSSLVIEGGSGYITADGNTFYRGAGHTISCAVSDAHAVTNIITNNTIDYTDAVLNTGIAHLNVGDQILVKGRYNVVTGNTLKSLRAIFPIHIYGHYNEVKNNTLTIASWYDAIKLFSGATYNVVTGNVATGTTGACVLNDSGNATNTVTPNTP